MSFITPMFHSVIVTDIAMTVEQMYIHHDQHRLEVMGNQRCSLRCTAIYPSTNIDVALGFFKRTPHPRAVKILSPNPTPALKQLAMYVERTMVAFHQEYLQSMDLANEGWLRRDRGE